jgi:hypothetical protein
VKIATLFLHFLFVKVAGQNLACGKLVANSQVGQEADVINKTTSLSSCVNFSQKNYLASICYNSSQIPYLYAKIQARNKMFELAILFFFYFPLLTSSRMQGFHHKMENARASGSPSAALLHSHSFLYQ